MFSWPNLREQRCAIARMFQQSLVLTKFIAKQVYKELIFLKISFKELCVLRSIH